MPNIKITAEVDGKIIPLNTISTETFEAIKALEKPKEVPIARIIGGSYSRRLLLKMTPDIRRLAARRDAHILSIEIRTGRVCGWWNEKDDTYIMEGYGDIKLL